MLCHPVPCIYYHFVINDTTPFFFFFVPRFDRRPSWMKSISLVSSGETPISPRPSVRITSSCSSQKDLFSSTNIFGLRPFFNRTSFLVVLRLDKSRWFFIFGSRSVNSYLTKQRVELLVIK